MNRKHSGGTRCVGSGLNQVVAHGQQGARAFGLDGGVAEDDAQSWHVEMADVALEGKRPISDRIREPDPRLLRGSNRGMEGLERRLGHGVGRGLRR